MSYLRLWLRSSLIWVSTSKQKRKKQNFSLKTISNSLSKYTENNVDASSDLASFHPSSNSAIGNNGDLHDKIIITQYKKSSFDFIHQEETPLIRRKTIDSSVEGADYFEDDALDIQELINTCNSSSSKITKDKTESLQQPNIRKRLRKQILRYDTASVDRLDVAEIDGSGEEMEENKKRELNSRNVEKFSVELPKVSKSDLIKWNGYLSTYYNLPSLRDSK